MGQSDKKAIAFYWERRKEGALLRAIPVPTLITGNKKGLRTSLASVWKARFFAKDP
jgi:hypothetical protein